MAPQLPDLVTNPAKWRHDRVVQSINSFEENLDLEHEVGARLVSFGTEFTFHIEDVGYWGPDMITFTGRAANARPRLGSHRLPSCFRVVRRHPQARPGAPDSSLVVAELVLAAVDVELSKRSP